MTGTVMGGRQMLMSKKKKPAGSGYPYKIHPLQSYVTDPSPLGVSKYFLVEALLRSPKALATYPNKKKFLSIFKDHGFNGDPLLREHHVLMRVSFSEPDQAEDDMWNAQGFVRNRATGITDTNILDLAVMAKLGPSVFCPRGGEAEILHLLRNPLPRFIFLRLDVSKSANAINDTLRPFLMEKCQQYKDTPTEDPLERLHREALQDRFDDIPAWIDYFKCYDLWWSSGGSLSHGQIATTVYGKPKSHGRAKTALRRATEAIEAAEAHTWPPKDSSHKPSR